MSVLFTAEDLRRATGGVMTVPFHATGVSIDTRTLVPGDLFVALVTGQRDGHGFVADAFAHGAAGAMVHREDLAPDCAKLLSVHNTLAALQALGAYARGRFEGAVVAVTGSVGKTTVKEMLRSALAACGAVHAAHASYNNHWGVPLTLARMAPDADYGIVEIGMNHRGEVAPLARLAAPNVAIITAVGDAHIGNLGSEEAIADEKASIAEGLLRDGVAVLPRDTPHYDRLADAVPSAARIVSFGADDVRSARETADGTAVEAAVDGRPVRFHLRVPGPHMVSNALACLAACVALGADLDAAARALAEFSPVVGRGVQKPILAGGATLLDESYNASPASVRAALAVLKAIPARRRIAVLGDMLELGDYSTALHAALAEPAGEAADLVYACGPSMHALFEKLPPARRGAHAPTSAALAPIVAAAIAPGDAVLVKGSLGSKMSTLVDALTALPVP